MNIDGNEFLSVDENMEVDPASSSTTSGCISCDYDSSRQSHAVDRSTLIETARKQSMVYLNAEKTPIFGALLYKLTSLKQKTRQRIFKLSVFILTFATYCCFHLSRKPSSVVESAWKGNNDSGSKEDFVPFTDGAKIGVLDTVFLLAYAIGLFISGSVAERMDLRYFLAGGTMASGFIVFILGFGYSLKISFYGFYAIGQFLNGLVQSSGWPAVVTCMGNWYGLQRRGLIMSIWNANQSVGNILGSVIAGIWADSHWDISFFVPGLMMIAMGLVILSCLVPYPEYVNCQNPQHLPEQRKTFTALSKDAAQMGERDALLAEQEKHNKFMVTRTWEKSIQQLPPVTWRNVCKIPGVVEFSLCLFFNKLVGTTFLIWLPTSIVQDTDLSVKWASLLSTIFDMGGLIGGIILGYLSDLFQERSLITGSAIFFAAPSIFLYSQFRKNPWKSVPFLFLSGFFVNGSYSLVSAVVAADLGTRGELRNERALATVTGIINGTAALGAAFGPLVARILSSDTEFIFLILCDITSFLFLFRIMAKTISRIKRNLMTRASSNPK